MEEYKFLKLNISIRVNWKSLMSLKLCHMTTALFPPNVTQLYITRSINRKNLINELTTENIILTYIWILQKSVLRQNWYFFFKFNNFIIYTVTLQRIWQEKNARKLFKFNDYKVSFSLISWLWSFYCLINDKKKGKY